MPPSDPLSVASGDASNTPQENQDDTQTPLDQQILDIVKACPKDSDDYYTVKPARLSAELGISIEDATAELCGLLAAVGGGHDGASFVFETTKIDPNDNNDNNNNPPVAVSTMVFRFPQDFQARAQRKRQKEDFQLLCWETLGVVWKATKILTAFGLILSLMILTIAAMIGIIAAIVAMSTNNQRGNANQRGALIRQLRVLFYTVRQLLWCYALYGQHDENQDPFVSEMAYDAWLLMSVCCGHPGSFFWWWRVQQLNRRRRFARRGWGRGWWNNSTSRDNSNELETDVEGVRLIRRGDWSQEQSRQQQPRSQEEDHRGLLSIAVEYLFGPVPFQPGPTEAEVWKLRGAAIVKLLAFNEQPGVSLQQLSPYMDHPPKSLDKDKDTIVTGGLQIVSHFNGTPAADKNQTTTTIQPHLARFHFPELASESQFATRYDGFEEDDQEESWGALLCLHAPTSRNTRRTGESATVPSCLIERKYQFTNLQSEQFFKCVFLGTINLVGVVWLRASLEPPNGVLQLPDGTMLASFLKKGLVPVLYFYAILFFALPAGRLLLILCLNARQKQRNNRRRQLASALEEAMVQ